MGCSFSGLNALYDAVNGGGDLWINENRFRVLRQLGEGGFAYVYLVKEVVADGAGGLAKNKSISPSHLSGDGVYAMKKVLIQSDDQLELVRQEIHVSSLFSHPNLLPLLDHAIIQVKGRLKTVTDRREKRTAGYIRVWYLQWSCRETTRTSSGNVTFSGSGCPEGDPGGTFMLWNSARLLWDPGGTDNVLFPAPLRAKMNSRTSSFKGDGMMRSI